MEKHDIIVIGASAGGVSTLLELVTSLPADLPAAVFVVIHFPAYSTSVLPDLLSRRGPLPAKHARDGDTIQPGHIYTAPPDFHLLLQDGRTRLWRGPRENHVRPAIDQLFRSAAQQYDGRVIGVILSGTLSDGTAGLISIKRTGGIAVVQDPEDALFPEMPRSAVQNADVDHIVPVTELGALLTRLVTGAPAGPTKGRLPVSNLAEPTPDPVRRDQTAQATGSRNNQVSVFTCPECGGAMWQMNEERLIRFRCHVGHAYTGEDLYQEQTRTLENSLWYAARTLADKAVLARQLADKALARGHTTSAQRFQEQARVAELHSRTLQQLIEHDGIPGVAGYVNDTQTVESEAA